MYRTRPVRVALLLAAIVVISVLHYSTPTHHIWLHPLFQRLYYVPLLLMAIWFGWRGAVLASLFAAVLYLPHIHMSWSSHPEYSATQQIEVFMFFVITVLTGVLADHERKQREKAEDTARQLRDANLQLQNSFEQLRRADRLSAMGELSAGLAHEIRNPLGSIDGALQILRRERVSEETKAEFGELAQRELDRLKGIVNQFLDFARPREPRLLATDPHLLLESVAKLTAETAKMRGIEITVSSAAALPDILVDAEQIKQVLLNLVINAIQAMPNGGTLHLRALADKAHLQFEVEDRGVGIEFADLDRIFDPFFTKKGDGTGLGLSIAARIIAQHGGEIEPHRNPDCGMTFTVRLPLFPAERAARTESLEAR